MTSSFVINLFVILVWDALEKDRTDSLLRFNKLLIRRFFLSVFDAYAWNSLKPTKSYPFVGTSSFFLGLF